MPAIILNHSHDGTRAEIIKDDAGNNRVFSSVEEADMWRDENDAEIGRYSRILNLED